MLEDSIERNLLTKTQKKDHEILSLISLVVSLIGQELPFHTFLMAGFPEPLLRLEMARVYKK